MSLKTVLYNGFYLLYIGFSTKVGNDIFIIRFIQKLLYISSVKHFDKQLKRQIDNQKHFPSDDIPNRFIVTQAVITITKSWNRLAILDCFIMTQAAITMAESLNRSNQLHLLDNKNQHRFSSMLVVKPIHFVFCFQSTLRP